MNERSTAQPECAKTLNTFGMSTKNLDGIICTRCHNVVIKHTHAGVADSTFEMPGGRVTKVEVKAGGDRLAWSSIRDEQWQWLQEWELKSGVDSWFWIMLGTSRVNARNAEYPRQTYFVTRTYLSYVKTLTDRLGVKNLPCNATAAKTRIVTRDGDIHAEYLLGDYRMDWVNGLWWWPERHPFWILHDQTFRLPKVENAP